RAGRTRPPASRVAAPDRPRRAHRPSRPPRDEGSTKGTGRDPPPAPAIERRCAPGSRPAGTGTAIVRGGSNPGPRISTRAVVPGLTAIGKTDVATGPFIA